MRDTLRMLSVVLPVVGLFFTAVPAAAFKTDLPNYRCSGSLVYIGDSQYRVSRRCGEPDDSFAQDSSEVWVYNFGQSRFVYYFTFTNDRLQRIRQVACDADNPDCPYFR